MTRSMTFWAAFQKSPPYSLLWGLKKQGPRQYEVQIST
jgi:hypothetical protein